jgi:alanine-synthesizing transaminase
MFSERTNWNLDHNKLSEALAAYRSSGKPLLDLTQSNPTTCGFHYQAAQILAALNNSANLVYEPVAQGLPQARQAVAEYYASRHGQLDINDIFLTTSTSEAYSFLFRALCNVGDEVLIPQPGYPLLNFLADIQDLKLVRYPLVYDHGWQIDFHSLQQLITARARAIVVVHPNNPTGHFCKPEDIHRLNEICHRHELAILADEVFLDFSLGAEIPRSFADNHHALTFAMSGLSKISGLPQMKMSWFVVSGPPSLKQSARARLEIIADTYLSMNAPMQLALGPLLNQRHSFHAQWLNRARHNIAQLDQQLGHQKLCSRLEIEGGWYAVVKIPVTASDDDLALELLNSRGVYLHPGHFYDFPSDGYVVLSLITPEQEFAAGISALFAVFQEQYRQP